MQIFDIIAGAQGGQAIANLARAAGVPADRLEAAVKTALPELVNGIERNTLSRGGLADLVAALGDGHHEVILDHPGAMADPRVVDDGNAILGHLLGSKDRSRSVALQAAQASGISDSLIKMLLPFIAQMVMGAIAKWAKGGLGDIIQKIPGGGGAGQGEGLPFPLPQGRSRGGNDDQGPRGGRGSGRGGDTGGGFELPQTDRPQGGFPMPPIPGSSGAGQSTQPRDDGQGGDAGGGGFQIPWPREQGGGNAGGERSGSGRSGGGRGLPFPFPFPQQPGGGGDGDGSKDGGFQIPWPTGNRAPERRSGGGASGGFELPQAELPQGGFPMPPMPGGSSRGNSGASPDAQGSSDGGNRNNPYGDLSDILRRGGKVDGAPSGGLVRNILGGLLGFGGSGIFGWFIRLIVMRFGWGLLKRFLGRALTGR